MMEIWKEFTFDAAHRLPYVPETHKCYRLHGHTYRAEIRISGEVDKNTGWVMDFSEIADAFASYLHRLDHHYLNEMEGLVNPTAENIARWIWEKLEGSLPLHSVTVQETEHSGCTYRGD
jgi:6-pyruvoyltetrahydropterin/6-carboxytetrahydropterin synthase